MDIAKTATFAVVHFSVAFAVGYALTGSVAIGGLIALVEPMVNTVAFYLHEKAWKLASARADETKAKSAHGLCGLGYC
ncbi:Membrane protein-like protein [Rhodospirillaceae bacterium LM-1]|nr:Membrane protein-like protein [Rhodospirillaceae bacterium LM-1]